MRKVCIQVDRRFGERLRTLLVEHQLLDPAFPITSEDGQLLFPLQTTPTPQHLDQLRRRITTLTLVKRDLHPLARKPRDLESALKERIPSHVLAALPNSFDIIGNIAIVELADDVQAYAQDIGQAIAAVNPKLVAVYAKAGSVTGIHRTRPLRLLVGEPRTQTVHTEYGVRLVVDVAETYFSPRLGTEHDRVSALVRAGEVVVDMFAGVGPFALLAAKRQPVTVYALDVNEHAIRCLEQSLKLNRLRGEVIPLLGDSRRIVLDELQRRADRIIMNLPHDAFTYLDVAAAAVKAAGGTIHFYGLTSEEVPLDLLQEQVTAELSKHRVKVTLSESRLIRDVAPHEAQVVLDLHVVPADTVMTT
jgi:tRNA (guanine37-N1)-methyltransferase